MTKYIFFKNYAKVKIRKNQRKLANGKMYLSALDFVSRYL